MSSNMARVLSGKNKGAVPNLKALDATRHWHQAAPTVVDTSGTVTMTWEEV
jgi:hypothetical protein